MVGRAGVVGADVRLELSAELVEHGAGDGPAGGDVLVLASGRIVRVARLGVMDVGHAVALFGHVVIDARPELPAERVGQARRPAGVAVAQHAGQRVVVSRFRQAAGTETVF